MRAYYGAYTAQVASYNGDENALYTCVCDCFCPAASVHHIFARNTLEQQNILLRIDTKLHTITVGVVCNLLSQILTKATYVCVGKDKFV